jgi:hypothetical protein
MVDIGAEDCLGGRVSWRVSRVAVTGCGLGGGSLREGVSGSGCQGGVSPGRVGLPCAKKGSRRKDGDGERWPGPALTQAKKGSRKRNPDCF